MTKRKKKGRNGQENKLLGWEGLEDSKRLLLTVDFCSQAKRNTKRNVNHTLTSKIIDYLLF